MLQTELSRKTVQSWRNFAMDSAFQTGIDHLRHNHAPRLGVADAGEMLKNAFAWQAYQQALSDVEDVLTALPKKEQSIEQPGLVSTTTPEDEN
jgi:hypothetical protein